MGDRSDDMEREDEVQGPEWSVVESNRKKRPCYCSAESMKRVKVGNKSNDVSKWKVVVVFDVTPYPINQCRKERGEVKLVRFIGNDRLLTFYASHA